MNLLDLSNKVDSLTVETIQAISNVAAENDIKFFVVGARARDFILELGCDLESMRGTEDIDLAFRVSTWEQYKQLVDSLLATGNFSSSGETHRFYFKGGQPIDIIPFGPIGDENIYWPPDHDIKMNIIGFEDAYNNAQWVRLQTNPDLEVRFASPAGLALMKIISWQTGNPERKPKDAYDLNFIIKYYSEAGNEDRLYNEYPEVLEKYEFDNYLAGAYLLGLDISNISKSDTLKMVLEILNRETIGNHGYELINNMTPSDLSSNELFENTLNLLSALKSGIESGIPDPN